MMMKPARPLKKIVAVRLNQSVYVYTAAKHIVVNTYGLVQVEYHKKVTRRKSTMLEGDTC